MQMRTDQAAVPLAPPVPHVPSFPRKPGGGFTFQCNTLSQNVAAGVLSARHLRGVLFGGLKERGKPRLRQGCEISLAGPRPTQPGRWCSPLRPSAKARGSPTQKGSLPSLWRWEWRAHSVPWSKVTVWCHAGAGERAGGPRAVVMTTELGLSGSTLHLLPDGSSLWQVILR